MSMFKEYDGLVIEDPGGLQKEGFFHSVPWAALRSETEWTEPVHMASNRLIPSVSGARAADDFCSAVVRSPAAEPNPHSGQHYPDIGWALGAVDEP